MIENVSNFDIGSWGITLSYFDMISFCILFAFIIGAMLGVIVTYLVLDKKIIYLKDFGSYWRRNNDKTREELENHIKYIEEFANKTNIRGLKYHSNKLRWLLYRTKNCNEED